MMWCFFLEDTTKQQLLGSMFFFIYFFLLWLHIVSVTPVNFIPPPTPMCIVSPSIIYPSPIHPLPIYRLPLHPYRLPFLVFIDDSCFTYVVFVLIMSLLWGMQGTARGRLSKNRRKAVSWKRQLKSTAFWWVWFTFIILSALISWRVCNPPSLFAPPHPHPLLLSTSSPSPFTSNTFFSGVHA